MYLTCTIILVVMIAAFVLSSIFLKSPEISMVVTAICGVIVGMCFGIGDLTVVRSITVLIEGLFQNLDLAIQFCCAALFVNIYSATGALDAITRGLLSKVNSKWIILVCMAVLMLIPGALTGAGSVSVFVLGGLVAKVVKQMGLSDKKATAFVFMFAIMSAAAPPINLWTMLITAGCNMPYVGFTWPLLLPIIIAGAFTIVFLGWGSKKEEKAKILAELPEVPEGMNIVRILFPIVVLVGLILLSLYAPFKVPVFGMPLIFLLSGVASILCNPKKTTAKEYLEIMNSTMEQVFPLVATVISVGALVNVMAATGVRGLVGITFVTMPIIWVYIMLLFFATFAQGALSYGSAILIGVPMIFMMNTRGLDTTICCAALSLIFPIGDCLPPSRIVGRVSIDAVGFKGSYMEFLKEIAIPCLVLGLIALIMFIKPAWFVFLK